jgi:uncharacterized protein (TIGR03083 family)
MSEKQEALDELEREYQALHKAVEGLDDEQLSRRWYDGWSVKEILAHVLGWEREMAVALERVARGERPTPEGVDYSNSDEWNAKFARGAVALPGPTVIAMWEQAHMTFLRAARAVPDDRYGKSDEGKPKTVSRLIETTGYGHYREHAPPILEWRKSQGL